MKFDIAFDESSRNADVYECSVKPLVTSLFDKWVCENSVHDGSTDN